MKELNIELRYFPPNATHLVQPCDSLVIQIIKYAWTTRWDKTKAHDVLSGQFRDKKRGSGKLINLGKHYFLNLGADAVKDASARIDDNGLNFARKAMMTSGLSKDVEKVWKVGQLRTELQAMIRRNQGLFDSVVAGTYVEPGLETEEEEEDSVAGKGRISRLGLWVRGPLDVFLLKLCIVFTLLFYVKALMIARIIAMPRFDAASPLKE